jgi:hypothetical protein
VWLALLIIGSGLTLVALLVRRNRRMPSSPLPALMIPLDRQAAALAERCSAERRRVHRRDRDGDSGATSGPNA